MKNLLILFLFLTCHIMASSQTDTIKTVTTDKDTVLTITTTKVKTFKYNDRTVRVVVRPYKAPVVMPPVTPPVEPPSQPPAGEYSGYQKILSIGYNTTAEIPTSQGPRNSLSTTIKTEGAGSFRSEVRASDPSTSSGYRSEVQYSNDKHKPVEGILEYDVYYENWKAYGGGGHTIQWHPDNGTGSATLCLYSYGGKFEVVRNLGSKYDGANYYQSNDPKWPLMTITPNKWYKMRWEFKWATSGGYVRLYIDGKLYYSYSGETMNNTTGMPYLKVGQNRWSMISGTNTVMYYDNVQLYEKVTFSGSIILDSATSQSLSQMPQWKLQISSPVISCAVDHGGEPCPGYPNPAPMPSRIDTAPPTPKTYNLELTEQEAGTLMYVISKGKLDGISGEDATMVALLIQKVTGQLRKQTTAK